MGHSADRFAAPRNDDRLPWHKLARMVYWKRGRAGRKSMTTIPSDAPRCCLTPARNSSTAASSLSEHGAHGCLAVRCAASRLEREKAGSDLSDRMGRLHPCYFVALCSAADLAAGRDAIAEWARLTDGWLGRSPDFKAALRATTGGNNGFYEPYQENARRW